MTQINENILESRESGNTINLGSNEIPSHYYPSPCGLAFVGMANDEPEESDGSFGEMHGVTYLSLQLPSKPILFDDDGETSEEQAKRLFSFPGQ